MKQMIKNHQQSQLKEHMILPPNTKEFLKASETFLTYSLPSLQNLNMRATDIKVLNVIEI